MRGTSLAASSFGQLTKNPTFSSNQHGAASNTEKLRTSLTHGTLVTTVDGHNPAPVEVANIPLFTRFYTSQVVQDFVRQQ